MRTLQYAVVCLLAIPTWSCGSSTPSGPAPPRPNPLPALPLTPGIYSLQLLGFDLSDDPTLPPCTPFGVPAAGKALFTTLELWQEGDGFTGRSTAGPGDLRLTVRAAGASGPTELATEGTISGTAVDVDSRTRRAQDLAILFQPGTDARISGSVPRAVPFVNGRIRGTIAFRDSSGATATCSTITFVLQPDARAQ